MIKELIIKILQKKIKEEEEPDMARRGGGRMALPRAERREEEERVKSITHRALRDNQIITEQTLGIEKLEMEATITNMKKYLANFDFLTEDHQVAIRSIFRWHKDILS